MISCKKEFEIHCILGFSYDLAGPIIPQMQNRGQKAKLFGIQSGIYDRIILFNFLCHEGEELMVKIHEVSTDSRLIETLPKEQQLLANRLFQEMGFEEVDESPALSGTVSQADKDFLMRTRPRPVRPISSRLYMQMNCDQTMERTKFEGGIAQQVAGELYDLVDFAPLKPESKEKVRDHLQQLKAMASRKASSLKELGEQAVACKAKIDALTPGEHFVMEGGWKGQGGSPGHAMLYLFKKNADGKYSLLVFNTGEGVQFHQLEFDGIKQ